MNTESNEILPVDSLSLPLNTMFSILESDDSGRYFSEDNEDFLEESGLIKRISARAKDMIANGAILEVKKFINLKVAKSRTASKAIGITEITEYINKKIQIIEVIEKISIKTRQYAKRQTTWGRSNMIDWYKVKPNELNKFLKKI